MKNIFKTFGLHIGVFSVIVLSFGIAYAAWDSTVNTGDQLTASSWNELVNKVKIMDNNLSFNDAKVGIGTSVPNEEIHILSEGQGSYLLSETFRNHVVGGGMVMHHARGTVSDPKILQNEDRLGSIYFKGYDGDQFLSRTIIDSRVEGTPTNNNLSSALVFSTSSGPSNAAESMRISGNGNVGIGTTDPQAKLHVAQSGNQPSVYAATSGSNYGVHGESAQNYGVYGKTNSPTLGGVLGYTGNGAVYGVLGHANRYSLYGNGDVHAGQGVYVGRVPASGTIHLCRDGTGYITYCTSDIRLKKNIESLHGDSADIISKLKPVSFDWKQDNRSDIGFIAQEVRKIIPESITVNPTDDYLTFNTTPIIAHLVKAFQDMQQQMSEKDIEIQNLQQELNILKNK